MKKTLTIPYDMYESQHELVILIPLGGVKKESIQIKVRDHQLRVIGTREKPSLRTDYEILVEECFRGIIDYILPLPANLTYNNIHTLLSKENILTIIIPKNIVPEHIPISIE